jgi:hypothetical protein
VGDFGLFGLLLWLTCFVALGTAIIWRPGRAPKMAGVVLVLIGVAPSIVALWALAAS